MLFLDGELGFALGFNLVEDMADELTIGRSIAYDLVQQPGFPSFMIGRRVLVSRKGLQEWIDRQCLERPENLDVQKD